MGKILVLAEKPSVGRELARVLGCTQSREGCIAGSRYIVTWALGHLVTLAEPEHYGPQYKTWSMETLPMLPDRMELVVIPETARQYKAVKTLLSSPEVDSLVIATDAGREGELVARWILQKAGFHKPVQRLWISSQTDKSIRDGFAALKSAREYDNLYASALSRAEADWYVGLNVTRALTCRFNAQLSAGRVQTPTLAMIVRREDEIRKFVPKDYYCLQAQFEGFTALRRDPATQQTRLFEKARAEELLAKLSGKTAAVSELKKEAKRESPPLLYDLTELQRDANRKYGYTAKQTLNLMQGLYEVRKLLTYPRTDARYLGSDIVPSLPERLRSIAVGDYAAPSREILQRGVKAGKRIVDDAKVTDHHAIIPTEQPVNLSVLTFDEKRIYDLVVRRFLAALSQDHLYEQCTVKLQIGSEVFTAKGKTIQQAGWKRIAQGTQLGGETLEDEEGSREAKDQDMISQSLPALQQGQSLKPLALKILNGKTKPPARFTEATLLSAMEHPGQWIDDSSLLEVLESKGGIGTPATRADIIEKMFAANYAERRGKEIFPLSKGIQLIQLVPEELRSPELTGKWEERLLAISKGKEQRQKFIQEIKAFAGKLVSQVAASGETYRHDNLTRTRCPLCDKFLLEINGKKGKMLVCQDRQCGYKQNLAFISNARCPQCHKKLEVVGEGEKRLYTCKCGFREKYERFNQDLQARKSNMGKQELQTYMNQQNQEAAVESAFALAWKKLQEK
ncbi:MAG TPA: DNA topoisomerase III [Peptococcaceae bacterium]|nr:DNA topoisomerase III [Peptococcaceae bacterium]